MIKIVKLLIPTNHEMSNSFSNMSMHSSKENFHICSRINNKLKVWSKNIQHYFSFNWENKIEFSRRRKPNY